MNTIKVNSIKEALDLFANCTESTPIITAIMTKKDIIIDSTILPIIPDKINVPLDELCWDEDEPDWAWEGADDYYMDCYIQSYALRFYGKNFKSYKYTKEKDYSTTISNIVPGITLAQMINTKQKLYFCIDKNNFINLPPILRDWVDQESDIYYLYIKISDENLEISSTNRDGENWKEIEIIF